MVATRAAFCRLPSCPEPALTIAGPLVPSWYLAVPESFREDSAAQFAHGGIRHTAGDTTLEQINGHWGLASFTGRYDGGGEVPAGCVARIGRRIYLVSERHDGGRFDATAMEVTDTLDIYGPRAFSVSARQSMRDWLLALLKHRRASG